MKRTYSAVYPAQAPSVSLSKTQLGLSLSNPFSTPSASRQPEDSPLSSKAAAAVVKRMISGAALALVTLTLFQAPALAKAGVEHLHTGQKIANFFMGFGLPKWAVLATISAMPVVELRGAVPVGIWLGMPITQVLPICVLGNMAPIIPLLFLLRNEGLK